MKDKMMNMVGKLQLIQIAINLNVWVMLINMNTLLLILRTNKIMLTLFVGQELHRL
jgi:hypothetical protein